MAYWSKLSAAMNLGGMDAASPSVLRLVNTIQAIGKKNIATRTQVAAVMRVERILRISALLH